MGNILFNRYHLKWIGRCTYDTSDKVWGWFYHIDPEKQGQIQERPKYCHVFWAATGKSFSFNRKFNSHYDMAALQRSKISKQYRELDMETFCSLWPNLEEQWTSRFVMHLLSNPD